MSLRICVVDDEESIRDTFKWHLEEQGHDVTTFECPNEMLAHFKACHFRQTSCFDIIFVDYNMPAMSGLDLLEHSLHKICKLPLDRKVLMSGVFNNQAIMRAKKMGVKMVQKPISLLLVDKMIAQISPKTAGQP